MLAENESDFLKIVFTDSLRNMATEIKLYNFR